MNKLIPAQLRIGNLIQASTDGVVEVVDLLAYNKINACSIWHYIPIELTPSWLERIGFPKDHATMAINGKYDICFERINDKIFLVASDNELILMIDFVHSFQNLYYDLNKGKEIEIKQLEKV